MPSVSLVVARSCPGDVIGRDNRLPWHLKSDLRRFREITLGHAIVMGAKTYASIGRPLPGRLNIVLSRSAAERLRQFDETAPIRVPDIGTAVLVADAYSIANRRNRSFVIGGSRIFRDFLDADLVEQVHLTEVCAPDLEGDVHFADRFPAQQWRASDPQEVAAGTDDDYPSTYRVFERTRSRPRLCSQSRFLSEWPIDQPASIYAAEIDEYFGRRATAK